MEAAGVKYLFGNPGTTEVALLNELGNNSNLEFILALHESVAVAMADGYARASGNPGVVCVHTAVGTANTLGMTINAFTDYSPVVIFAGIKDSRGLGSGIFCDSPFQVTELLRQYTCWSWQCLAPQNISQDTEKAINSALATPKQPAFLAIPEDFWHKEVMASKDETLKLKTFQAAAREEEIKSAAELIRNSSKPVILAGNEVGREKSVNLVMKLAEKYEIPVLAEEQISWSSLNFPNNHPLYCGCYKPDYELVQEADLLIVIGAKLFTSARYTEQQMVSAKTKIIHFHNDSMQIGAVYPVEIGLIGSVATNLSRLLETTDLYSKEKITNEDWRNKREQHQLARQNTISMVQNAIPTSDKPHVLQLVTLLSEVASSDAIIVNEGIRAGFYLQDHFDFTVDHSYFGYTGGCLGWGVPAALGIKMVNTNRQVIAFVGDGSFLFSNQALWTAAHYKLDVKIIVCNNRGYMAIKSALKPNKDNNEKNIIGDLNNPEIDIISLAQSFGVPATRIATSAELKERLEEFLLLSGPALLEVQLDNHGLEKILG